MRRALLLPPYGEQKSSIWSLALPLWVRIKREKETEDMMERWRIRHPDPLTDITRKESDVSQEEDRGEELELHYERGHRAAWRQVLTDALRNLTGDSDMEVRIAQWTAERSAVVASLRMLCDEYGDNDWKDNANLCDVLEKHLGAHLQDVYYAGQEAARKALENPRTGRIEE